MANHADAHDHAPNVTLYLGVCAALFALTVVTVWISKFHLGKTEAVALGLTVAGIKATLVAAVFMHLWGERKLIFYVLGLTVALGAGMILNIVDSHLTRRERLNPVDVAAQQPGHHAEGGEHGAAAPAHPESPMEKTAPGKAKTKDAEKKKGH